MENFLMEKHAQQYTGLDDYMSDDFVNWMEQLDVQEIIEYADEYLKDLIKKIEGMKRTKQALLKSERDIVSRDNYFYNLALKNIINLIK